MNNKILNKCIFGAMLLSLAACTQDELADGGNTLPEGKYPLEIASVTMDVNHSQQPWNVPQTRVSENADGMSSKWDGGETIIAQIGDDNTNRGTYTVNVEEGNVTLTPVELAYWKSTTPQKVKGWYPSVGETIDLSNQNTDNGLAYALYAETTEAVNYDTENISLPFDHKLAKIRIVLDGDKKDDIRDVKIKTYPSCTLGADGTLKTSGTAEYIPMVETTYNNGTQCWEANVVPGNLISEFMLNSNVAGKLTTSVSPEAGKVHEIKIEVSQKRIEAKPNNDGSYTINEGDNVYISGNVTGPITIKGTASVELKNVSCSLQNTPPVIVESGTPVITVTEENSLEYSGETRQGGIVLKTDANLIIEGTGELNIKVNAKESPGIGAKIDEKCGNITIKGITLTVSICPLGGVGIGAGIFSECGRIEIIDATVDATGAPAIGAAFDGYSGGRCKCGDIYIENSNVTATGIMWGGNNIYTSAIGSGGQKSNGTSICGNITIKNENKTESEILSTLTANGTAQKIGKGPSVEPNGTVTCGIVTIISKDGTKEYPDGIN